MNQQETRILVENITEEAAVRDRNKLAPLLGVVVEVGAGANAGMVRIRREPHEPTDVGRPFYFCVGVVPIVGTPVWCMANFATGFVFGDFVDKAYATLQKAGTPVAQQPTMNLGDGLSATDVPGSTRTDVALTPSEKLATTVADGFMPSVDKTKLNGVETGATADQTPSEILTATKTVDGTGSALDADLVDGEHASAFANSGHTHGEYSPTSHTHSGYALTSHTHGFPTPDYSANSTELIAGGNHFWNHSLGVAPKFIFFQVKETASASWKISAEGIAPSTGQVSCSADTTKFYVVNNETQTIDYRFYAFV